MSTIAVPIPVETPLVDGPHPSAFNDDPKLRDFVLALLRDKAAWLVTEPWANYLSNQSEVQAQSPARVGSVRLTGQTATIGATPISTQQQSAGIYRFGWFAGISVAASVSSSITVSVLFTHLGLAKSKSFTAITGNTNTSWDSSFVEVEADAGTPISYSVTLAFVGTTPAYFFSATLEAVQV